MARGFTLFELIIVMLLVGVLAAYTLPKLDIAGFRSSGFSQQTLSTIRFAQKLAISSGCSVQVQINTSSCSLNWNGCAGNAAIANPASGDTNFCADSEPEGTFSAINFSFNRIGAPSVPQSFTIDDKTITVEANTGFTHAQ